MTSTELIPTGHVGNLTPDEEAKLQQLWTILLQSWDTSAEEARATSPTQPAQPQHRRIFSLSRTPTQVSEAAVPSKLLTSLKSMGMSGPEIKSIQKVLTKMTPAELRSTFLSMAKQDHPDAFLLRFLRAEKWDLSKAFVKLVNAMAWRTKEVHVDETIVRNGELQAVQQSLNNDDSEKKHAHDFLAQLRMGKSYLHGVDKQGRPICVVRVRLHHPGAQTEKALNRYIVHQIETVRILLVPPVETMTLIFDLTEFSLANMEYAPVRYIIQCFQENYPESLGAMLFYNAPWFFSGIWKVIRGWLDPIVAAKVHFTKNIDELEQFIARDQIPKDVGGDENWEYEYIEPDPTENAMLDDAPTRKAILAERQKIGGEFFAVTSAWISATAEGNNQDDAAAAAGQQARRAELIEQLRLNYWKLDPYVRSRNHLDRCGVIRDGGKINFYPSAEVPVAEGTGTTGTETNVEIKVAQVEYVEGAPVMVVDV